MQVIDEREVADDRSAGIDSSYRMSGHAYPSADLAASRHRNLSRPRTRAARPTPPRARVARLIARRGLPRPEAVAARHWLAGQTADTIDAAVHHRCGQVALMVCPL